jgi:hypothetical protein
MLAGKHSREKTMSSTDERLAERRKKWADDTHIINTRVGYDRFGFLRWKLTK